MSDRDLETFGRREVGWGDDDDLLRYWMDVVDAHGIAEAHLRLYGTFKREELLKIYKEFASRLRDLVNGVGA